MEKAIIVYVNLGDTYKAKNRANALVDSLKELNDCLAAGWSVKQSHPMGGGSEMVACNLVILQK